MFCLYYPYHTVFFLNDVSQGWFSVCTQVVALSSESVRLQGIHQDQGEQISAKQAEMEHNWEQLKNKVGSQQPGSFLSLADEHYTTDAIVETESVENIVVYCGVVY